jgi:2-polyprenyl-3-methyl-5-hydroxy-6-metoxy-1,4-benzoquinol methylase
MPVAAAIGRTRCEYFCERRESMLDSGAAVPRPYERRTAKMDIPECPQCKFQRAASVHWRAPRFLRCRECGTIFRDPFPGDSELANYYSEGWKKPEENIVETGSTGEVIARHLADSLTDTLGIRSLSGMRILDFGAGRGAMTLELMKRGAKLVAVEPFGYEFLAERGVSVYRDLAHLPDELSFDGIVSLEVIEHLRDPNGVLAGLYKRLAPGGWLLITTPNAAGLLARLMGQRWREVTKPGHIVFFTPPALSKILEKNGFSQVQRPRWLIRYPRASPLRALLHFGLQKLAVDGGLRVVAYRPQTNLPDAS